MVENIRINIQNALDNKFYFKKNKMNIIIDFI